MNANLIKLFTDMQVLSLIIFMLQYWRWFHHMERQILASSLWILWHWSNRWGCECEAVQTDRTSWSC